MTIYLGATNLERMTKFESVLALCSVLRDSWYPSAIVQEETSAY